MIRGIVFFLLVGFALIVLLPKLLPVPVPAEGEDWREEIKEESRKIIQDWKDQRQATTRSLVQSPRDESDITRGPSILPSHQSGYGTNASYCPQGRCAGAAYAYSYILSHDPLIICYASGKKPQRYWGYDETITGPTPKYEHGCYAHKGRCSPAGWNMMVQQTYGY